MNRQPLLFHFLMVFGWSLLCFWFMWRCFGTTGGWAGVAFLVTGCLGCWVGSTIWEIGRRLRRHEDRIRKLEEELERRWRYVPENDPSAALNAFQAGAMRITDAIRNKAPEL
jgi:hypothetical protein